LLIRKHERPPGPRGSLLGGNFRDVRRDVLSFLTQCAREYGDIVRYRLFSFRGYLLSHPDYIKEVLVRNPNNFIKGRGLRANSIVFGRGMLTSEGEQWRRQRRLAQPTFHRERIAGYGAVMLQYAEEMLQGWRDGEVRDISEEMMGLTLQITARILFGADVADEIPRVKEAFEEISRQNAGPTRLFHLPDAIPTPANVRYNRAVRQLNAVVYRIIDQRSARGGNDADLLATLLQARDEDGNPTSRRQLRDEVITFFLGGHETSALALTWACYLLAQNPQAESALMAELDGVLAGRKPTAGDLPTLRYTEAVILEAMRLYPPAWLMVREAVNDCMIGGYRIPRGSSVVFSQWIMHRDPRYFHHPERFDPDRWLGGLAKQLPRFAYFPFGGGPRVCLGAGFAMTEAILLLASIAAQFHFDLVPGHSVAPMPAITLRPADGIKVTLVKRTRAQSAFRVG
jgi:cytochrome P450